MKMRLGIGLSIVIVIFGTFYLLTNHNDKIPKSLSVKKTNTTVNQKNKETGEITGNKKDNTQGSVAEQNGNQNENQQIDNIVEKYHMQFQNINTLADKREANLLEQAKKEVKAKKDKKLNVKGIQVKYAGILEQYEQKTKLQFDALSEQLHDETVKNKLPQTVEQQFQREYQLKKAERHQKFIQQLKKFV